MATPDRRRLNVSGIPAPKSAECVRIPEIPASTGEEGSTRIVQDGAVHFSRSQSTARHAHFAWKIHIGLDAPIWVDSGSGRTQAPAAIIPPNLHHATGAIGWSRALFISPGTHGTAWKGDLRPRMLTDRQAKQLTALCLDAEDRTATVDLLAQAAQAAFASRKIRLDARVEGTLRQLKHQPDMDLTALASAAGLSSDRLSRLVVRETGLPLRRHRLWLRLLRAMSDLPTARSLADLAAAAGFSDHAHLTRTFRAFLGRCPSEFAEPPDVVSPW